MCDFAANTLGFKTLPDYIRTYPQIGTLVIAWVMTEFTEPIRIGAAVVIVPPLAKALGVKAKQKPVPPVSKLKPDDFK